ncbi:hypothetical protein SASPL_109979 [Salvia splendens]|uniref:Uncharacterized protein n=1 Tax=Salvia splendens TaxID=180675 RepID=A0A8X8Y3T5_SALSN|nr:hypothetical protein SASPL_109979 [Salvia splendens]
MYRKVDKLLDSTTEEHKAAGDGGDVEDLVDGLLNIQQDGTEFPLTTENIKAVVLRKICTLELLSARRVQPFRHVREEETLSLCKQIASASGDIVACSPSAT